MQIKIAENGKLCEVGQELKPGVLSVRDLQVYVKNHLAKSAKVKEQLLSLCKQIKEYAKDGSIERINELSEKLAIGIASCCNVSLSGISRRSIEEVRIGEVQLNDRQIEDVIAQIPWEDIHNSTSNSTQLLEVIEGVYSTRTNSLRRLSLSGCGMSRKMATQLLQSTFVNMVDIDLSNCEHVTSADSIIQNCVAIQSLNLSGTSITSIKSNTGFGIFKSEYLRLLETLNVSNCSELTEVLVSSCADLHTLLASRCHKLKKVQLIDNSLHSMPNLNVQESAMTVFGHTSEAENRIKYQYILHLRSCCAIYSDDNEETRRRVDRALEWLDSINEPLSHPGMIPPSFVEFLDWPGASEGRNPAKHLLRVLCGLGYMPTLPLSTNCDMETVGSILRDNLTYDSLSTMTTILHYAAKKGLTDIVSVLIQFFPWMLNVRDCDGMLPVEVAIAAGGLYVVRMMVNLESNTVNSILRSGEYWGQNITKYYWMKSSITIVY